LFLGIILPLFLSFKKQKWVIYSIISDLHGTYDLIDWLIYDMILMIYDDKFWSLSSSEFSAEDKFLKFVVKS
jgi:hypothetical protein